jgi:hypothetical protein
MKTLDDIKKLQQIFKQYQSQDYIRYNEYVSRCTGRTHFMIEQLPAEGPIIIIVLNRPMIAFIKARILEARPEIDLKNIKFFTISDHNWRNLIKGHRGKIFVDHSVFDEMNLRNNMQFITQLNMECGENNV